MRKYLHSRADKILSEMRYEKELVDLDQFGQPKINIHSFSKFYAKFALRMGFEGRYEYFTRLFYLYFLNKVSHTYNEIYGLDLYKDEKYFDYHRIIEDEAVQSIMKNIDPVI